MAKITISELHPAGFELFCDTENFMIDLSEDELNGVNGGILGVVAFSSIQCGAAIGGAVGFIGSVIYSYLK
ncbi:hypothetical protein BJP34_13195 [Moorena producens PAL-8-15-08-1]|uniref:Bacteriocin n=1 Tax=Moorena producens PAL-8-15-08-1 TaxID=1458985 RepID=A0A1D8TRS8_9CYAN|nr:hypothetical protein [Moorena producens]AOX00284.1 hypothetical protein BJP34_13195 [Moorena producens PAL-8-15-08-1]